MTDPRAPLRLFVLTALLLLPGAARGQEGEESAPELVQDFFLLDAVYPQEQGEWQLSLAPTLDRGDEEDVLTTEASFEYGITDRLQVEGTVPYVSLDPEDGETASGLGDAELGVLYAVRKPLLPLAISTGLEVTLPTGDEDEDLGEGETRGGPFVLVARQVGAAQVHGGLSLSFGGGTEVEGGVAAVAPAGPLRVTLELAGESGDEDELRLAPGLLFPVGEGDEIGIAFAAGLTSATPDWAILVRGVWSFEP
jgi:hypothetical protein